MVSLCFMRLLRKYVSCAIKENEVVLEITCQLLQSLTVKYKTEIPNYLLTIQFISI